MENILLCMFPSQVCLPEIISFISSTKIYSTKYFLIPRYNFIRPGVIPKLGGNVFSRSTWILKLQKIFYLTFNPWLRVKDLFIKIALRQTMLS